MELIDKEALVQDLLDKSFYPAIVRRAIEQQPAIDAVEVVRCKNCQFKGEYKCGRGNMTIDKMVYVAHPFQGKPENVADAEQVILKLLKLFPNTVFLSPLHATGFYYFAMSYEDGMEHCFEMLKRCDELWMCEGWETSKGCNLEVGFAEEIGMPIKYISTNGEVHT